MHSQALFPRWSRRARAAIVALTFALTLGLASSASAASLSLGLTTQNQALTVTEAGTADQASYLFVYLQRNSTPCAATANAEPAQADGPNQPVIQTIQPITVPAGAYSLQQNVSSMYVSRGLWVACGYLAAQAYSSPGPMYHVPDAAATSPSVIVDPCGPVPSFSVGVTIKTKAIPPNAYADAELTVQSTAQDSPSVAIAGHPESGVGVGDIGPGGGSAAGSLFAVFTEPPPATVTETLTVSYYALSAQCSQPDGTLVDLTPPPQTFTVTWTLGGGGSTSLGGVFPKSGSGGSGPTPNAKNGVLTAPSAQKLKTILKSGVVKAGKVTASDPGTLTCNLMLGTKRLGRVTKVMKKGQTASLSFKLTAAGKRALRKAGKKPKLSVTTTFADASSHKSITSKASVKLS